MTHGAGPGGGAGADQRAAPADLALSDFDFALPEGLIALRPAEPRDAARLLVVEPGRVGSGAPASLADRAVRDLPSLLRPGDALVFNDTRVIPARLRAARPRGEATARIEIMLHQRIGADRYRAFLRPAKKVADGETLAIEGADLEARLAGRREGGDAELVFSLSGAALDAAIDSAGEIPLPPYIEGKRKADARDALDYQTAFAREPGAVAAPTAGLHFTPALLERLEAAGIERHFVTLHVGAGTFLPVKAERIADHVMHAEWGSIDAHTAAALRAVRERGGRLVAVGTTTLRLLESAAASGRIEAFSGDTRIFITPGYRFRAVDALITNFHLPKSTLLMLVSAFSGLGAMREAYAHAIKEGYRFYSYGDASLLFPAPQSA
jgi:S-adenosylmethionine:tRNA ribosyltransferase-isomerase